MPNRRGAIGWRKSMYRRLKLLAIAGMLVAHTLLLAWSGWRHSPVLLEVGHLPAGISHWRFGNFALYHVNPPLPRMMAALAVMPARPNTDWSHFSAGTGVRSETIVGIDFVNANGSRVFWLYTLGRWACIPFSWLGAWICYRWAGSLYGSPSDLCALALWCFSPNILGHGALMMPDAPAAALAVAASYSLWRWLQKPSIATAIGAGIVLGLGELTKFTLVVFYPLWPLLWIVYRWGDRPRPSTGGWWQELGQLVILLSISVGVINLAYGFEGTFESLGSYRLQSPALTGTPPQGVRFLVGNRFSESLIGRMPVPLPHHYVQGIDTQWVDFERGMPSYLHGQWREPGWWYFYLYALAIKVPLGTWMLAALAAAGTLLRPRRPLEWRDAMLVAAPPAAILLVASLNTGFTIHFRYVLAVLPFLFIGASRSFTAIAAIVASWSDGVASPPGGVPRLSAVSSVVLALALAALGWSIAGSLWHYPHSLSYFNELAGGSPNGDHHLLDSNISWGQDLLYLKRWYDEHPQARPFYLAIYGIVNPRLAGIEFHTPPPPTAAGGQSAASRDGAPALPPGWYAIDVNFLHGGNMEVLDETGALQPTGRAPWDYGHFESLRPVDRVGGSLRVFHIPSETVPGSPGDVP